MLPMVELIKGSTMDVEQELNFGGGVIRYAMSMSKTNDTESVDTAAMAST